MSPSLCLMSRETSVEIVDTFPVDPGLGGPGGWVVVLMYSYLPHILADTAD